MRHQLILRKGKTRNKRKMRKKLKKVRMESNLRKKKIMMIGDGKQIKRIRIKRRIKKVVLLVAMRKNKMK